MAEDPLVGTRIAGYLIESVIGRGGMGVVYRAEQVKLRRPVALKLIAPELAGDPSFRARFERESRTAARIEHPNVIAVYEADEEAGHLFIAMRFIDGTDLSSLLRAGPLDPQRAVNLVAQVAGGLDAAHAHGLVHRDVKPANVLVAGTPGSEHAYLTDFGLTKDTTSVGDVTATGQWVGTPDYIAPEQAQGQPIDARTDVYALGCVLFHALTGRVPFPRDSALLRVFAHVHEDPPSLLAARPALSPVLETVVGRAMAKAPEERYPSAGDLGRAALAAAEGAVAVPPERSVARGPAAPGGAETALAGPDDTRVAGEGTRVAATGATAEAPTGGTEAAREETTTAPAPAGTVVTRRPGRALVATAIVALAALLALAAVLLLGGGDGDEDGGGSRAAAEGESVGQEDFRRRANLVCRTFSEELRAANDRLQRGRNTERTRAALAHLIDVSARQQQALGDIEPPAADRREYEILLEIVETQTRVVRRAHRESARLPDGDAVRAATAEALSTPELQELARRARTAGATIQLDDCVG